MDTQQIAALLARLLKSLAPRMLVYGSGAAPADGAAGPAGNAPLTPSHNTARLRSASENTRPTSTGKRGDALLAIHFKKYYSILILEGELCAEERNFSDKAHSLFCWFVANSQQHLQAGSVYYSVSASRVNAGPFWQRFRFGNENETKTFPCKNPLNVLTGQSSGWQIGVDH